MSEKMIGIAGLLVYRGIPCICPACAASNENGRASVIGIVRREDEHGATVRFTCRECLELWQSTSRGDGLHIERLGKLHE